MNNNIPSIEELEELVDKPENMTLAASDFWNEEDCIVAEVCIKALLTLLKGIEEGKWAIVPCEATELSADVIFRYGQQNDRGGITAYDAYNIAIKAAPDIMKELFGGCDAG